MIPDMDPKLLMDSKGTGEPDSSASDSTKNKKTNSNTDKSGCEREPSKTQNENSVTFTKTNSSDNVPVENATAGIDLDETLCDETSLENEKLSSELEEGKQREDSTDKSIEGTSQATTVDITELESKAAHSLDLFASQTSQDMKSMDCIDFAPPFHSTESSQKSVEEMKEISKSQSDVSGTISRKRKLEDLAEVSSNIKIPKVQTPCASTSTPKTSDTNNSSKHTPCEDVDVIDEKSMSDATKDQQSCSEIDPFMEEDTQTLTPLEEKSEKVLAIPQKRKETVKNPSQESVVSKEKILESEYKPDQCKMDSSHQLCDSTEVVPSAEKMVSKEMTLHGSDKSNVSDKHVVQSPRESIEVVFSSFPKEPRNRQGQNTLANIPEENGDGYESQEDDFCLRLSVSPSQLTPSKETAELRNTSKLSSGKSRQNGSSQSDTSQNNSHLVSHNLKSSSEWNSHSSNDFAVKHTSSSAGCKSDEVEILSPEGKKPETVGVNGSSDLDSNDVTLVEVVPGKGARSGVVCHKDMNGTPGGKLKQHSSDGASEGIIVLDGEGEGWGGPPEGEQCKRSRGLQLPIADADDTPPLQKMKDLSSVPTQTFDLKITVEYTLRIRTLANDRTHIISCEPLECREVQEQSSGSHVEVSDSSGNAADVSKNSSPSSVVSLGPFSLTQRTHLSRLSTSTSSSSGSTYSVTGSKSRTDIDSGNFAAPSMRAPRAIRERYRISDTTDDSEKSTSPQEVGKRSPVGDACHEVLRSVVRQKLLAEKQQEKAPHTAKSPADTFQPVITAPEELEAPAIGDETLPFKKEEVVQGAEPIMDTPKSTKKSRVPRIRNTSRSASIKTIKEVKEEEEKPATPAKVDQQHAGSATSELRRTRRTPLRQRRSGSAASAASDGKTTPNTTRSGTPITTSGRTRRNRSEALENSHHTSEWPPEGCFSKLVTDARVFARWTDRKYYSGKIKEQTKDGRWMILFDDGNSKSLKDEFIIPVKTLPKGQSVFAQEGEEDCQQGLIVGFKVDREGEVLYGVDLDSGNKVFYPRSKLFMYEDQARLLQETMDPKSSAAGSPALTTVTCENIVQHKRPRSNRVLFGTVESPGVSGVTKTSHRRTSKGDSTYDNSCSSSVSDSNDKNSNVVLEEELGGVEPEVSSTLQELSPTPSSRGKGPGRIKNKSRTPRCNEATNHTASGSKEYWKLMETLGPIPERGSVMFKGSNFLLSHTNVRPRPVPANVHSSDGESEEYMFRTVPFVKDRLRQQIESGGGRVYDHFEDIPVSQYENCLIVSDGPCLTAKYIQCLANGIRMVSNEFIVELAKGASTGWDCYKLPSGWSLEESKWVATGLKTRQKPLSKKEVGLVNDSQAFIKFWGQILEKMGAKVQHIAPEQEQEFPKVHIIVTDSSCPPEVEERAREWSIPLVSTVWVTQSLITGRARSFDAHLHYRYDYCASD